jgi:hypothetical protein
MALSWPKHWPREGSVVPLPVLLVKEMSEVADEDDGSGQFKVLLWSKVSSFPLSHSLYFTNLDEAHFE